MIKRKDIEKNLEQQNKNILALENKIEKDSLVDWLCLGAYVFLDVFLIIYLIKTWTFISRSK